MSFAHGVRSRYTTRAGGIYYFDRSLLLGDSVVYGHGVEFEHTMGHYLERRSGLRVANLGRPGDCAFQEAYLLTAYLPVFTPRFVVHVFSPNDIQDLHGLLSEAAMRAFIAQPVVPA
jgi:hypothetical protein